MTRVETKEVLIVVRTYPVPDALGIESSCTAGITRDGKWIRIFPVPWRLLGSDRRFHKYQWVKVQVFKSTEDSRLESYRLQLDTIEILPEYVEASNGWSKRRQITEPLRAHCACCLARERNEWMHPTLGLVLPGKISRLRIVPSESAEWSHKELAMLRQQHFFAEAPEHELEKIPYKFYYQFTCPHEECKGHTMMCTDWEMSESYRKWRRMYGEAGWESKFRQRYETEMLEKLDTHFFLGTVAAHPNRWIIIGLFYPPKRTRTNQMSFLDAFGG